MIVVYNPLILIEAVAAGGLSTVVNKVLPNPPKHFESLAFLSFLALIDLGYRYWRVRKKAAPIKPLKAPITPDRPHVDWAWLVSPKGGHLLWVPGWVISLLACSFTFTA